MNTLLRMAGPAILAAFLSTNPASPVMAQAPEDAPPSVVRVEPVMARPVTDPRRFSGTVEAIEAVDVQARVQGFIEEVDFEAGQSVEKGDQLYRIDAAPYEAAAASARAGVAQADAQKRQAEQALERQRTLTERNVAARARLEEAEAAAGIAEADVEAAEAGLRQAEIELGYTTIAAPIAGEIGRSLLSEGNLVGPQTGTLARIVQLDPVRVVFSVSERLVLDMQSGAVGAGVGPEDLRIELELANGATYPQAGRLEYLASEADTATGTVPVRLVFPNPDHVLVPGLFVDVVIGESDPPVRPIVPQTAVLQDREGRFVYVVADDDTVRQRRIETGARVEDGWAVTAGLDAGEPVVVEGIQRIRDGAVVSILEGRPVAEEAAQAETE